MFEEENQSCYVISGKSLYENTWFYLARGNLSWSWCDGVAGAFFFLSREAAEQIWARNVSMHPEWERAVQAHTVAIRKVVFHPVGKLSFPSKRASIETGDVSWSYMHRLSQALDNNDGLDSIEQILNTMMDEDRHKQQQSIQTNASPKHRTSLQPATKDIECIHAEEQTKEQEQEKIRIAPILEPVRPRRKMQLGAAEALIQNAVGQTGRGANAENAAPETQEAPNVVADAKMAASIASSSTSGEATLTQKNQGKAPANDSAPGMPETKSVSVSDVKTETQTDKPTNTEKSPSVNLRKREQIHQTASQPDAKTETTLRRTTAKSVKPGRASAPAAHLHTEDKRKHPDTHEPAQRNTFGVADLFGKLKNNLFRNTYAKPKKYIN